MGCLGTGIIVCCSYRDVSIAHILNVVVKVCTRFNRPSWILYCGTKNYDLQLLFRLKLGVHRKQVFDSKLDVRYAINVMKSTFSARFETLCYLAQCY